MSIEQETVDMPLADVIETLKPAEMQVLYTACIGEGFDLEFLVCVTDDLSAPKYVKSLMKEGLIEQVEGRFLITSSHREAIMSEFQFIDWGERNQLYSRAIKYWASKANYQQAFTFAKDHQLWSAVADVLLSCSEMLISAGKFEELHQWFNILPGHLIDQNPLLMVFSVWSYPEYQKINGAENYLKHVEQVLEKDAATMEKELWIKASVHLHALYGYIARISGDYQRAVACSQQAVTLAREGYPAILSRLYTTIGQDLYFKGDVIAAESSLVQAMLLGKQYNKHHDVLISLGYAIAAIALTGRLSKAEALYKETLHWCEESGFLDTAEGVILKDIMIDVYRIGFNYDKAYEHSNAMLICCDHTAPALHHLTTHIRRYRLAMNIGNAADAYNALTKVEGYCDLLSVSWSFGWAPVSAMRAEYEMRYGQLEKASHYFQEREAHLQANASLTNESECFIYAEWLLRCGKHKDACQLLVDLKHAAQLDHRTYHVILADIQLAITLQETDPARAVLHLRDALINVPNQEPIVAPFLWFGDQILPLLDAVGSKLYQALDSLKLLKDIKQHAESLWGSDLHENILNLLSERQLTILRLLVEGDQDKVIARKLDISPGTVKTHLRTIYRKLECGNRSQAVSIAMENGLLLMEEVGV